MVRFEIDEKRYLSDALDNETIVMDMLQGRLFLFEGGAAILWDRVTKGDTRAAMVEQIEAQYGFGVRKKVDEFLDRLMALELVSEIECDDLSLTDELPVAWPAELGELTLTEYDDMASIITMDPIHDVDPSRGWPFEKHK